MTHSMKTPFIVCVVLTTLFTLIYTFLMFSHPVALDRQFVIDRFLSRSEQTHMVYNSFCGSSKVDFNCIRKINDLVSMPAYKDPQSVPFPCWIRASFRRFTFGALKLWMSLSASANVSWWLEFGSVLGAVRHGDLIPHDHDSDIGVFKADEARIRQLVHSPLLTNSGFKLMLRPSGFDGLRRDCRGKAVREMIDLCSFNGPIARIVSADETFFLDIFLIARLNATHLASEYPDSGVNADLLFPLTTCSFIGLTVPCPRKPVEYVSLLYRHFHRSGHSCRFAWLWKRE